MITKERMMECKKMAEKLVSQMTSEEKVYQLRHGAPAIDRLGIPSYNYWNESLHGVARAGIATVFPQAIGLAASFDEELLEKIGDTISTEGRAKYVGQFKYGDHGIYKGLTFWAPNINIFRDPRWGRGHETYGEDPFLTSRLGVRFVKGVQGDDKKYLKAAACAKHFAVHSGPEAVRHGFNAVCNKQDLRETYLPAFKALVCEAGVEAVMGAYNRTNGEVCCGSKTLLKDILRDEWGFEGHVTSDCWAIKDFHGDHGVTKNPTESVALAMNNGCDLNCGNIYQYLEDAVAKGLTTQEKVDNALVRVLATRFKLGILGDSSDNKYNKIDYSYVDTDEARALNLKAALESIVLLDNKNDLLPLDISKIGTIGVIGPNADNRKALVGNYEGTASEYVTVVEGIREAVKGTGTRVMVSEGCHLYKDKMSVLSEPADRIAEAKSVCEFSDVVVLCVGLDASLEGEEGDTGNEYGSGDKPNLNLPGIQGKLLDEVTSMGKPVIVVCLSGSALYLDSAYEKAAATIVALYPGAQGGRALAQIIFGAKSPEGKLPVTFYSEKNTLPDATDYSMKGRTYRYMHEKPFYPFGYGLSYTSFTEKIKGIEVNGKTVDASEIVIKKGDVMDIDVEVENTGKYDSAATVQVYVSFENEDAPVRQLKGLKKVSISAGEKTCVRVALKDESFALFDTEGILKLNKGKYVVSVGNSQPDDRSKELTGTACETIAVCVGETENL
ncbi:MAG: glycoside hydrolase family 3 C-terminal domain-containing protein [Lachnospiraceae bacterium]|nr:glycoside hydrolase family 3 C-terminal domain-containing protein [Lachnospiraceae bacterium]